MYEQEPQHEVEKIEQSEQTQEQEALEFLDFLSGLWGVESVDHEFLQEFPEITDQRRRLTLLASTDFRTAVQAMIDKGGFAKQYTLLRLQRYNNLIKDAKAGDIRDAFLPTARGLADFLIRDIFYAEMKGHPALAALIITQKRCAAEALKAQANFLPPLKGSRSGVEYGKGYLGNYGLLLDIYDQAYAEADHQNGDELEPNVLEHQAVLLAADWYYTAIEYNNFFRGPGSPYTRPISVVKDGSKNFTDGISNPLESIDWARLAPGVRDQFRGMRQSIGLARLLGGELDMRNIGRFIGKSGNGRFGRQKHLLEKEKDKLRQLRVRETISKPEASQLALQTTQRNQKDAESVRHYSNLQLQTEERKFQRSLQRIEALELEDADRQLMTEREYARHNQRVKEIEDTAVAETSRLESRNPDQLITDLEKKLEDVKKNNEQMNSVAAKAIELFFHFNVRYHKPESQFSMPLDIVDWINTAPFGTIKRAYRALKQGVSDESIIAMAVTEIIFYNEGFTRERFDQIMAILLDTEIPENPVGSANHTLKSGAEKLALLVEINSILIEEGQGLDAKALFNLPLSDVQYDREAVYNSKYDKLRLKEFARIFGADVIKLLSSKNASFYDLYKSRRALLDLGLETVAGDAALLTDIARFGKKLNKGKDHGEHQNPVSVALAAGYTLDEIRAFPDLLSIYLTNHLSAGRNDEESHNVANPPDLDKPLFEEVLIEKEVERVIAEVLDLVRKSNSQVSIEEVNAYLHSDQVLDKLRGMGYPGSFAQEAKRLLVQGGWLEISDVEQPIQTDEDEDDDDDDADSVLVTRLRDKINKLFEPEDDD